MTREAESSMDEVDRAMLDCLARMESHGDAAVEAIARERPAIAEALRQRMALLGRAGLLVEPRAEAPRRLGEFELLELLGGGGMGTVYLARQESLGREVAVKVVRADLLYLQGARRRFRLEAEVLARLHHPGIVPVLAAGEEGGVPYLVMERVRGATLAAVLDDIEDHAPFDLDGADLAGVLARRGLAPEADAPLFAGAWPEVCARVAAHVARALAHAHGNGVLHRDVKPSNVFVCADGRVQLFDFGLARAEGAAEHTATRSPVGSLPYMSPEQLKGDPLDERVDVYGLGALLFEMLALSPPFHGATETELRAAILAGDHVSLRRLHPGLPRDLESVCLRAIDRDPERRYATADALASDLRNVLERRPVTARAAGPFLRARRWAERHPARAVALAGALVIGLGGPVAFGVQRGRAAASIAASLAQAEDERARAEDNLDHALEAVVVLLGEVGGPGLEGVPGMDESRAVLLEKAVDMLDELMPQRPGDPALDGQRARLQREKAGVLALLGRDDQAEAAFAESVRLFRALPSAAPENGLELAVALSRWAKHASERGDVELALERENEVVALLRPLADAGGGPEMLEELAVALHNRAFALARLGRYEDAVADVEATLRVAERLEAAAPQAQGRYLVGTAHAVAAQVHALRDDLAAATEAYRRALPVLSELCAGERPAADHRYSLGAAALELGRTLWMQDRFDELEEPLALAVTTLEALVAEHPSVAEYERVLQGALQGLSSALLARDMPAQALPLCERAAERLGVRARRSPEDEALARDHGMALSNLANVLLTLERPEEGLEASTRAVDALEPLVAAGSSAPGLLRLSALTRLVHAQARTRNGEYPDPRELERLARERAPGDAQIEMVLAGVLGSALATVEADPAIAADARAERVAMYRDSALAHLERAIELGYASAERLERTRELDPLRSDPRFEALAARLGPTVPANAR